MFFNISNQHLQQCSGKPFNNPWVGPKALFSPALNYKVVFSPLHYNQHHREITRNKTYGAISYDVEDLNW